MMNWWHDYGEHVSRTWPWSLCLTEDEPDDELAPPCECFMRKGRLKLMGGRGKLRGETTSVHYSRTHVFCGSYSTRNDGSGFDASFSSGFYPLFNVLRIQCW